MQDPVPRHRADELIAFAAALLRRAGLDAEMAADVAAVLVEGDLLGRDTHGLRLLAPWLAEIEAGRMAREGAPRVFNARAVAALWDGQRLPGPWLVRRAIDWAAPRAAQYGCAGIVVRGSHHAGCLAAYLEPVARAGLLIQLACSDSGGASGAPFGDVQPVPTSDPVAVGIPTSGDPILIGMAAPATTVGPSRRLADAGDRGAHDADHRGCAPALLVEALTAGLAGRGPADPADGWAMTVSIQIHDPAAFGGLEAMRREIDHVAAACRASQPRDAAHPARLPGEHGLACKREQLARGVRLHAGILDSLVPWARRFEMPLPAALA